MDKMPIITLKGGIRVGNFSSKHEFRFDDGSLLPGCSAERCNTLMLNQVEVEYEGIKGTVDIELTFHMSTAVRAELARVEKNQDVDIVLVPFPVSRAMADEGIARGKTRGVRTVDRVKKIISATRFCI